MESHDSHGIRYMQYQGAPGNNAVAAFCYNQFLYTSNIYIVNTACMRIIIAAECARNGCGELGRLVGRPTMDDTNGCAGTDNVDGPCGWPAAS